MIHYHFQEILPVSLIYSSPFGCNLSAFTSLLMPDGSFTGQAEPVVNIITTIFISFSDELFARLLFAGKAMPEIISM